VAEFKITIDKKGLQPQAVKRLVIDLKLRFGKDATVRSEKVVRPKSRADRFKAALDLAEEAKLELEGLKDEMDDWYGNLGALESSPTGEKVQEARDALDNLVNELDSVVSYGDVDFPRMYES
jgi:hypothetical protein